VRAETAIIESLAKIPQRGRCGKKVWMLQLCRMRFRTQNRNTLIHKRFLPAAVMAQKPHAVLLAPDLLFLNEPLLNAA
jgi:hypothetical protein